MTFRDLFRRDPPRADDAASPVDDALEHWVVTATLVAVGAAVGAYLAGVFS